MKTTKNQLINEPLYDCTFSLKLEVKLDDYKQKKCIYKEQEYYNCYFPMIKKGYRKQITNDELNILTYNIINNIFLLNGDIDNKIISNYISTQVHTHFTIQPKNLIEQIEEIRILFNENKLQPKNTKIKKYWINPMATNKQQIYHDSVKNKTLDIINDFFSNEINLINEKITIEKIAHITGISVRTLKTRLTTDQKSAIKKHNKKLKSAINIKKVQPLVNLTNEFEKLDKTVKEELINDFIENILQDTLPSVEDNNDELGFIPDPNFEPLPVFEGATVYEYEYVSKPKVKKLEDEDYYDKYVAIGDMSFEDDDEENTEE